MAVMRTVKKVKDLVAPGTAAQSQEVEFTYRAPDAKRVCVAGTFNDWNTTSMPLKKEKDGTWRKKVKLAPGRYEYKYFVDGAWIQDTPCAETALNSFGTYNCVIGVKAA
jgi:1,4-alpha-glucan branching enzyme